MNVKELRVLVNALPESADHLEVMLEQTNDEYSLSAANEAVIEEVKFTDHSDPNLKAVDTCLVIRD